MRRLINTFCVSLFVSHFHPAMSQAQAAADDAQALGTTFLCRFTDGPHAGHTEPLLETSDRSTVRAGSSCSDGIASTGVVIAPQASTEAASPQAALTSICQFSSGPRAGEIADLGRVSGAPPMPVGSTCSDGASSKGIAIAAPDGAAPISWSSPIQGSAAGVERAVSTICQFMSGPKAHGWHDYAPLPAAPLGSPCRDGVSSAGIVMAAGHGQAY
jgi:type IV secretory pathway VirB2 component (pilin)